MKLKQPSSVDQSDRKVPFNLRQSGPTPQQMLISTRVRKNLIGIYQLKQDVGDAPYTIECIILGVM